MELSDIQALMNQFEDSDIRELKIDQGDFHFYLSKNKKNNLAKTTVIPESKKVVAENSKIDEKSASQPTPTGTVVKAPIVGIVYLQSKPGKPAYVKVGDHVNKGDTICVIEAMKMMTEVKSTVSGTVSAINVENEDLVEVDQPLITVKED